MQLAKLKADVNLTKQEAKFVNTCLCRILSFEKFLFEFLIVN